MASLMCEDDKACLIADLESLISLKRLHDAGYNVKDICYRRDGWCNFWLATTILQIVCSNEPEDKVKKVNRYNEEMHVITVAFPPAGKLEKLLKKCPDERVSVRLTELCHSVEQSCEWYAEPIIEEFSITAKGFKITIRPGVISNQFANEILNLVRFINESVDKLKGKEGLKKSVYQGRGAAHQGKTGRNGGNRTVHRDRKAKKANNPDAIDQPIT